MFRPPPPRSVLRWVGVDFDGTIARSAPPRYELGEPYAHVTDQLAKVKDAGYKIRVYTARPWSDYELIEAYMEYWCLPYDEIVCGKMLVVAMFDDRGFHAHETPDWLAAIERSGPPN